MAWALISCQRPGTGSHKEIRRVRASLSPLPWNTAARALTQDIVKFGSVPSSPDANSGVFLPEKTFNCEVGPKEALHCASRLVILTFVSCFQSSPHHLYSASTPSHCEAAACDDDICFLFLLSNLFYFVDRACEKEQHRAQLCRPSAFIPEGCSFYIQGHLQVYLDKITFLSYIGKLHNWLQNFTESSGSY